MTTIFAVTEAYFRYHFVSVFFPLFCMSKKLFAAMSLLVLAACNTTADVTTDEEVMVDDEAMMEGSSSSEAMEVELDVEAAMESSEAAAE